MKTMLITNGDGVHQIVLTPENKTEEFMLVEILNSNTNSTIDIHTSTPDANNKEQNLVITVTKKNKERKNLHKEV